jgi:hypothetical protein
MASSSSSSAPVQAEAFPDGTSDYVPVRTNKKLDPKKPHITDQPITLQNWYQHVNWLNTILICIVPMAGLIGAYWVPLHMKTLVFSIVYYFYCGLGITAGKPCLPDKMLCKNTNKSAKATTDCGHIGHTRPVSPSESSLLLLALAPWRAVAGGGALDTGATTVTRTLRRIPTRSARVSSTRTLDGWS